MLYQDSEGHWIAECEEIPGYRAQGTTKEDALNKIKAALLLYYPCRCEE